jgi:hypothetical protein
MANNLLKPILSEINYYKIFHLKFKLIELSYLFELRALGLKSVD